MAGRQRQLVLLTRVVRRYNSPDGSAFPPPSVLGRRQKRMTALRAAMHNYSDRLTVRRTRDRDHQAANDALRCADNRSPSRRYGRSLNTKPLLAAPHIIVILSHRLSAASAGLLFTAIRWACVGGKL
jgi:hypothetical protein